MRKNRFRFSFKEHLSIFLIFLLLISQTIQVSFFDATEAATDDYRDIVSIIVDRDTYSALAPKIKQYSADIQSYLGNTRVSLFIVPKNTPPQAIAAENERLYYDGDSKGGITSLVGTILIGNVPIPVVHRDGDSFPSLFPYVDFDDKRFVYNNRSHIYQYTPNAVENSDVEIWHGVINPSVGREWGRAPDIAKIGQFLDKTHDFYSKKGKFAGSNAYAPRVFYYDGYNESAALNAKSMYQYGLSVANAENFAYSRFTKYLLSDLNKALQKYDNKNKDTQLDAFASDLGLGSRGSDSMEQDTIDTIPDIQTARPIAALVKKFYETINKKTLSDEQLFVHNAGRYNSGSSVRIDQATVQGTLMDEVALSTLKEGNAAMENAIDTQIVNANYARKMYIFDKIVNKSGSLDVVETKTYNGYFFGQLSSMIRSPEECTIARGYSGTDTDYGQSVRVEANVGYDVSSTQAHANILKVDTEELTKLHGSAAFSCFNPSDGNPKIKSYWGGNTMLRVAKPGFDTAHVMTSDMSSDIIGFSLPIYSLEGMKETKRLKNPSLADCMAGGYEYSILAPYTTTTTYTSNIGEAGSSSYTCTVGWPDEWNLPSGICGQSLVVAAPRYDCLTTHEMSTSIPTIVDSISDYNSRSCFAGSMTLDGRVVKRGGNTCFRTEGGGDDIRVVDNTLYEDRAYHSIPSLWRHISPTTEEVVAADKNGVTPSLPVDIKRSFEFLTPKGAIAHLEYPDFFTAPAGNVVSLRAWLKDFSERQWNTILAQEGNISLTANQIEANGYLSASPLPLAPIDWNTLISDAALEKIIQSRHWLHPDITEKAKNIVETSLSYSHIYAGDPMRSPPLLPETGSGYDIAYLGLKSLTPLGTSSDETSAIENSYNTSLAAFEAVNMGEDGVASPESDYKASAQCGPPDGVMIFQWPSAIMCWVSSLLPPKISNGSCGGSTIGSKFASRPSIAVIPLVRNDPIKLKPYYDSAKLVYSISKTVMQPNESQAVRFDFITPSNEHIELPSASNLHLDIISLESSGVNIASEQWGRYLEVAPDSTNYTNAGGEFSILSHDRLLKATLRATISTPLSDGSEYVSVSDTLTLKVSDEYIDITPLVNGVSTGTVDTTLPSAVELSMIAKSITGTVLDDAFPYTLDIYNSFDDSLIETGIVIPSKSYTISYTYSKKIGSYKFVVRDKYGRSGETTLTVRSGPISRVNFTPVSSALIVGSDSLGILRLTDKLGNILTPELHSIDITANGGYLIDADGKHVDTLHLDSIESELILSYGSKTEGNLTLSINIDGTVSNTSTIKILPSAQIILERSARPQVGGAPVIARIKILDADNNLITGFSSVANLTLPQGAGYFLSGSTIEIHDGISSDVVFMPGRVAGNHLMTLDVPGIGTLSNIIFSIDPGKPMYITPSLSATTFSFTLKDRYGNISPDTLSANITRDTDPSVPANFTNGIYSDLRKTGYYTIKAPSLEKNTFSYSDTSGTYTLTGISYANLYVPPAEDSFSFLPDYNARYTILAGESYLRQGENILYNVTPGKSSSLAVSTLLDSPYRRDPLLSIIPGGGIAFGHAVDAALTPEISLEKHTVVLTVRDDVTHSEVGRIGYPMVNPERSLCQEKNANSHICEAYFDKEHIRFIGFESGAYTTTQNANSLSLGTDALVLVHYVQGDGITLAPGVKLSPEVSLSDRHLVLSVMYDDQIIGRIIMATDVHTGVLRASDITTPRVVATPILSATNSSYGIHAIYVSEFDPSVEGYAILTTATTPLLDENRIGPNHMDSIGALKEIPGVGWKGQNRTLLSYSAGDTVGEASRWFHTYTYVNLGDPVAHIDHGALGTQIEGIDRTIGTEVASSVHGTIRSYAHKDMNHDGLEDIVVVYDDGFIELLLNLGGRFRSKKMIAYIPDLGNRGISIGDFRGDGYGDIIALDASGGLILLDNDFRKLTRTRIVLDGNVSKSIPSGISQIHIFDMDHDGNDDIVYLTDAGVLGILYGTAEVGKFTEHILDKNLGVSLSSDPDISGGAFTAKNIPQLARLNNPSTSTGTDDTTLKGEVYYQRTIIDSSAPNAPRGTDVLVSDARDMTGIIAATLTDPAVIPDPSRTITYVRSEYSSAYGAEISKIYTNTEGGTVHAGNTIRADISIKNIGTTPLEYGEYLDTIPKIFDSTNTHTYRVTFAGVSEDKLFEKADDTYDAVFQLRDIPVGATLHITYDVQALPVAYGEMLVDRLEGGEVGGDDLFGDVGFKTSTTCGAEMILWRSLAARDYQRGTRTYTDANIPDTIKSRLIDADKNGVPDSLENMSLEDRQKAYKDMGNGSTLASSSKNLIKTQISGGGNVLDIGLSPQSAKEITNIAQNLADGLSCGFGGGSCMSFPLNWAPLAPGSTPSIMGMPLKDLTPSTGLPIFSALTCLPITLYCGTSPCTLGIPTIWPMSPLRADSFGIVAGVNNPQACGTSSFSQGAGGMLGTDAKANFLRVYVTPTLTLGMGTAMCFGAPASTYGTKPGKGLSPFISGGNCIVTAKAMPVCKGDGGVSDVSVVGISGLGGTTEAWNGGSCSLKANTMSKIENKSLNTSIIDYLKSPDTTRLNSIYSNLSKRGPRSIEGGPLMTVGGGGDGSVSIEIDSKKPFNLGNIIKVKNRRVAAFPDFIMDWVARQTDEIVNKLFTLPNLVIIPPTDLGPNASVDGSEKGYNDLFSSMSDKVSMSELKSQMNGAFDKTNVTDQFNKKTTGNTSVSTGYNTWLDSKVKANSSTINSVQGSANALKSAYKYIGQMPFLRINRSTVNVNVPWPLPQELDKYMRSLDQYTEEINNMKKNWCNGDPDAKCLDSKTSTNLGALKASIDRNIKVINTYRHFPEKIQKYVTWRQKYTAWALCNIDTIQQFTGKWLKENGVRFQKWAEFYVLMKTIVESWQPVIDIFKQADAQCGVCQNQRYTLDYFKFKLLSMLIPTLPVVVFPKWPDVVLDLSDVRFAINVNVPEFSFNVSPIRLPNLPSLGLPRVPSLGFKFPTLPTLPSLPNLPDLPELPSLPRISFPPLPPPPKLPKIFGTISVVTNLIKLYQKVKCLYQKTLLIPEWQAGDVIAQRTSRQGTLPFDFLNLNFPQLSIKGIKEIRVQSHVNFELQSDFVTEFARSAVKPINQFSTDLGHALPSKIGEDINVQIPPNVKVKLQTLLDGEESSGSTLSKMMASLDYDSHIMMDVDEFIPYFRQELLKSGQSPAKLNRSIQKIRIELEQTNREITENQGEQSRLLHSYINAEEARTKEIEKFMDRITHPDLLLSENDLPSATFVGKENDLAGMRLEKYQNFLSNSNTIPSLSTPDDAEISGQREALSLDHRMNRLAANVVDSRPIASPDNTASGYRPKLEGIYIITPGGIQTRLFDYIAPLTGDEMVDVVDIDQDGDKDYLYIMDNVLYVKYNHTKESSVQQDTTLNIFDLDPNLIPEAPNFFHEVVSSPREINLDFSPARVNDRGYRLEFFDHYTEWDLTHIGIHDEKAIPRSFVDILLDDPLADQTAGGIRTHRLDRVLESVNESDGFSIEGATVTTLSAGKNFTLTPGRPLFTGIGKSHLIYSTLTHSGGVDIILKPHTRYTFDESLSGSILSGRIYFFDTLSTEKTPYSDDLIGMPILDGMKMRNLSGNFQIRDTMTNSLTEVTRGGEYRYLTTPRAPDYSLSFPYENGLYSARLSGLDSDLHAGITLLAPQASLDQRPPVVDLDATLRIPVYQKASYAFSDIITDMSPYEVAIDGDVTQDENSDGIYDNDFRASGLGFLLSDTNMTFGPFDTLGPRQMILRVRDIFGNTTTLPLRVDVYAPIPTIRSMSATGYLHGEIESVDAGEPVHLMRIRGGSPIDIVSKSTILSQTLGSFNTGSLFTGTGAWFVYSGSTTLIDESTGLPVGGSSLRLSVIPSNSESPMRFDFANSDNVLLFEQFLILPSSTPILLREYATGTVIPHLLIESNSPYHSELATPNDPNIAGGAYITDIDRNPIATLSSDGNISTLVPGVTLRATKVDGYLMIILEKSGVRIASVSYKLNFFFTVK